MMRAEAHTRCPVCGAPFRHSPDCVRCGADLRPVMTSLAEAWSLRQHARQSLRAGDYRRGVVLAQASNRICQTATSQDLIMASQLLYRATHRADGGFATDDL